MRTFASIKPGAVGALASPETEWTWLRDGTPVRIRPIEPTDLELERGFVNGLSRETTYRRLMSGRNLLPGELERWTDIDHAREIAVIALASVHGIEQELGDARCVRDDADARVCDFAIVIGDEWQHHGLGRMLLRRLMRSAADAGVEVLSGITLSINFPMLALAWKLGFQASREAGDATVTRLEIRLEHPVDTYPSLA